MTNRVWKMIVRYIDTIHKHVLQFLVSISKKQQLLIGENLDFVGLIN